MSAGEPTFGAPVQLHLPGAGPGPSKCSSDPTVPSGLALFARELASVSMVPHHASDGRLLILDPRRSRTIGRSAQQLTNHHLAMVGSAQQIGACARGPPGSVRGTFALGAPLGQPLIDPRPDMSGSRVGSLTGI